MEDSNKVPSQLTRKKFIDRLRKDASVVLEMFATVPTTSSYYVDIGPPPPPPPAPKNLTVREQKVAAVVFDVHSRICAWRLLTTWRSAELVAAALKSLEDDQLVAASALVRSLLENAAALDVESTELAKNWQYSSTPIFDESAALRWRSDVNQLLSQSLWGTREYRKIGGLSPERTQIGDLIRSASKHTGKHNLRSIYYSLCDVVHPCRGANSAYYAGSGLQGGYEDLIYVELSAGPHNDFDRLKSLLLDAWHWSLRTIETGLKRLARVADCVCMAGKLYTYGDLLYWGVVRPTTKDGLCPCGSGVKFAVCQHTISDEVIGGRCIGLHLVGAGKKTTWKPQKPL